MLRAAHETRESDLGLRMLPCSHLTAVEKIPRDTAHDFWSLCTQDPNRRGRGADYVAAVSSLFLCFCRTQVICSLKAAVPNSSLVAPALSKSSLRSFAGKVSHCIISAAPKHRRI